MESTQLASLKTRAGALVGIATLVVQLISPAIAAAADNSRKTKTPIQHVIVIIGENRTFDHIFATYQPRPGETISNLLGKGIDHAEGPPGPNFPKAHQNSACDVGAGGVCPNSGKVSTGEPFEINPDDKALYDV